MQTRIVDLGVHIKMTETQRWNNYIFTLRLLTHGRSHDFLRLDRDPGVSTGIPFQFMVFMRNKRLQFQQMNTETILMERRLRRNIDIQNHYERFSHSVPPSLPLFNVTNSSSWMNALISVAKKIVERTDTAEMLYQICPKWFFHRPANKVLNVMILVNCISFNCKAPRSTHEIDMSGHCYEFPRSGFYRPRRSTCAVTWHFESCLTWFSLPYNKTIRSINDKMCQSFCICCSGPAKKYVQYMYKMEMANHFFLLCRFTCMGFCF